MDPITMMAIAAGTGVIQGIVARRKAKQDAAYAEKVQKRQQMLADNFSAGLEPQIKAAQDVATGKVRSAAESQMRLGIAESANQLTAAAATGGAGDFRRAAIQKQRSDNGVAGETAALRSAEQARANDQINSLQAAQYQARSGVAAPPQAADGFGSFIGGFSDGASQGAAIAGMLPGKQSANQKESARLSDLEAAANNRKRAAALQPQPSAGWTSMLNSWGK